jgi:hypothetical protein
LRLYLYTTSISFPYIEVTNFDGWLVQITARLRGKNLHLALQEEGRPKPPVGENDEPVEQTAAAKKLLTKSQDLWDAAADRAAMADLIKVCRKDADTKLLTETGNFPTALSLLTRLKERFKSTVSRQLDVAHQEIYNFALRPKEPPRQFVNRYDAILLRLANLKKPVDEEQKISHFLPRFKQPAQCQ